MAADPRACFSVSWMYTLVQRIVFSPNSSPRPTSALATIRLSVMSVVKSLRSVPSSLTESCWVVRRERKVLLTDTDPITPSLAVPRS